MPVREMLASWTSRRDAEAREWQEAALQQADMPRLQAEAQVLQLPVLDEGRILCRREDAGQEGEMLAVHQRAGSVRALEGRQDFLEEAPAEMISSAWCGE